MTADDGPPSTEAEFRTDLRSLLRRAHDAGVDVEGAWECRNGADRPDWEAVVSELRKPDPPE